MATATLRSVLPQRATWPMMAGPLVSMGQSGKLQVRSSTQIGRQWTETFPPLAAEDATVRAWLAYVTECYRSGTAVLTTHIAADSFVALANAYHGVVVGASQTGTTIVTNGWVGGVTLRAGSFIQFDGMNVLRELTADVTTAASGTATLTFTPAFYSGASPADGANCYLTCYASTSRWLWRVMIAEPPNVPDVGLGNWLVGFTLTFRETG